MEEVDALTIGGVAADISKSWSVVSRPSLRDESERQYKSRKRDNPHRLLHTTMDQIRKTIPDGLPTAV